MEGIPSAPSFCSSSSVSGTSSGSTKSLKSRLTLGISLPSGMEGGSSSIIGTPFMPVVKFTNRKFRCYTFNYFYCHASTYQLQ